ncbi:MAG: 16S rRNA (guanine(527)-N(7))-methyltransferase RsmG [Leptospirales bacterium]|nr:16S rRNA (guanine(527)-N(7))-methyltransferase RsmG [Leptospirales bacterium]
MKPEQIERMAALFKKAGINTDEKQLSLFAAFYNLLTSHNDKHDLTRIKNFDGIVIKHFIDSVYFTKFITLPASIIDIGTGGGFPGIPLKIMNPELKLTLAEPKSRRVAFLEKAVQELGFSDTVIYPHLVTDKSFLSGDAVITRALESVNDTLTRVSHFLPEGALVLFMKGPDAETDLREIDEKNTADFNISADSKYTLPGTSYKRRLIVFTKTGGMTKRTYRILKNEHETIGAPVTSPENKTFKELKKLSEPQGIKKYGKLIVSGKKIITEVLSNDYIKKEFLIIYDGYQENDNTFSSYFDEFNAAGKLLILKRSLYNELDIFNTLMPLLSIETPQLEEWDGSPAEGCSLLIPFQDPQNVGAAIRNAAAFDLPEVILLQEAAFPFHPKVVRTSAGAVFKIKLLKGGSIYDLPKKIGAAPVIPLDRDGASISSFKFPEKFYLLPGIEGPGLPDTDRERSISIPLDGNIDSLNGATAAAIAIYEWKKQSKEKE